MKQLDGKRRSHQGSFLSLNQGLLKLRVNPANEAVARCVSTLAQTMVAQGCFKRELEGLSARLEARSGAAHPWQSLTTRRNLMFYHQKAIDAAELQMPLKISI